MQQNKDFLIDILHVFILFSIAFSKPLYVLSSNAEFFVARHSRPIDIILLLLILCILIPGLFVLLEAAAGLFNRRFRKGVHYFIVAGLTAVTALTVLKSKVVLPGTVLLTGAVIIGIIITLAYIRFNSVRKFATILLPAIFLFPGLFLFNSQVTKIVFPEKELSAVEVKIDNPVPIVMVIFDEFPITSLMNEDRLIDPIRYPNFAELAQDSYWFRNATTVAESTEEAVPAILSGNYPDKRKLPIAADYPKNIFTFLGGTYDLNVFESVTSLCPDFLCSSLSGNTTMYNRIRLMFLDASAIYLHIILPDNLTEKLPTITQNWTGFWKQTIKRRNVNKDGLAPLPNVLKQYNKFYGTIRPIEKPALFYLHMFLPHVPYRFLPSGRQYYDNDPNIDCLNVFYWCDKEWPIIQRYQRHLLQIGFVDKKLGEIIKKLKDAGIYDRLLIIVTSDHGVSFKPNDARRIITDTNYQDILPVALLIKKPFQDKAIISDKNVEQIDILPTIADVLGTELPWRVDGQSVFDENLPEKKEKIVITHGLKSKKLVFEASLDAKYDTLDYKLSLFGSGAEDSGLFRVGPYREIIGSAVEEIGVTGETGIKVKLENASFFNNLDLDSSHLPSLITGRVTTGTNDESIKLAISVNGTIRSTTQPYYDGRKDMKFTAMVPESSFRNGHNKIEVFVISAINKRPKLKLTNKADVSYALNYPRGLGSLSLLSSDNKNFRVARWKNLIANLDIVTYKESSIRFEGWAADIKNFVPAESIVIFVNGEFFYSGKTGVKRSALARNLGSPALKRAGFRLDIPRISLENGLNPEIRLFALWKNGSAEEMRYPEGYKWGVRDKTLKSGITYSLFFPDDTGAGTINSSKGETFRGIHAAIKGNIGRFLIENDIITVEGWAADVKRSELPEAIIVFIDEKFFFSAVPDVQRPDVSNAFEKSGIDLSGFRLEIPLTRIKNMTSHGIRVFAISKRGFASEIKLPKIKG